ncbi:hypothetical protein V1504DRAFT_123072 [Lipomyces starkeyi]
MRRSEQWNRCSVRTTRHSPACSCRRVNFLEQCTRIGRIEQTAYETDTQFTAQWTDLRWLRWVSVVNFCYYYSIISSSIARADAAASAFEQCCAVLLFASADFIEGFSSRQQLTRMWRCIVATDRQRVCTATRISAVTWGKRVCGAQHMTRSN